MPRVAVDRDGEISMPFAGEVKVAGLTPQQAGAGIEAAERPSCRSSGGGVRRGKPLEPRHGHRRG
ncbi:MAG: polysaccharide biosynthesis/export family protein [Hyphomonadaceae bacterium]|nr:polysaccharide biosynthesis/export family protein [Hyphomonadaceae bacterium]